MQGIQSELSLIVHTSTIVIGIYYFNNEFSTFSIHAHEWKRWRIHELFMELECSVEHSFGILLLISLFLVFHRIVAV